MEGGPAIDADRLEAAADLAFPLGERSGDRERVARRLQVHEQHLPVGAETGTRELGETAVLGVARLRVLEPVWGDATEVVHPAGVFGFAITAPAGLAFAFIDAPLLLEVAEFAVGLHIVAQG